MLTGHITQMLDTPEIVKSVESGDTGDTEGGPQAGQLRPGARGRGEEGEAPWVRGHSQQVQGCRSFISEMKEWK